MVGFIDRFFRSLNTPRQLAMNPLRLVCIGLFLINGFLFHPNLRSQVNKAFERQTKKVLRMKESPKKVLGLITLSQHLEITEPEQAIEYAEQALAISQNLKFKEGELRAHQVLGAQYYDQLEFVKARNHLIASVNGLNRLKSTQKKDVPAEMLARDYLDIARTYIAEEKSLEAIEYYQKSQDQFQLAKDSLGWITLNLLVAETYLRVGDEEKAAEVLAGGSNMSAAFGHEKLKAKEELLAKYLQQRQEAYEEAREYQEKSKEYQEKTKLFSQKYSSVKDSLLNEKDAKAEVIDERNQLQLKQALISMELEQKEAQQQFTLMGLILALLVAAAIYYSYRTKKIANKELAKKNIEIEEEKARSEELLLNILPAETAEELKRDGKAQAQGYNQVTVLFSDFKGFSQIAEKMSPHELVSELHAYFEAFDGIIGKYGIEKIKTIGDAYMCAGGLPVANETHALDVVRAGLEIQEYMEKVKAQKQLLGLPYFEARLGIHTGPVVAGIVGIKKFAYDIWGDTVNTAARLESEGKIGKVNISQNTFELVQDQFTCSYRGKIPAKNKGEIDMYFVEGDLLAVDLPAEREEVH